MAVSQAFMFHFKWYSLLHFAVCQFLCWALLLSLKLMGIHAIATEKNNQYLEIFPGRIEIFLQKYVGQLIIKQASQFGDNLWSLFFVIGGVKL